MCYALRCNAIQPERVASLVPAPRVPTWDHDGPLGTGLRGPALRGQIYRKNVLL